MVLHSIIMPAFVIGMLVSRGGFCSSGKVWTIQGIPTCTVPVSRAAKMCYVLQILRRVGPYCEGPDTLVFIIISSLHAFSASASKVPTPLA